MDSYEESVKLYKDAYQSAIPKKTNLSKAYKDSKFKINYDFLVMKEAELIKKICEGNISFIRVFSVYYFLVWNGFFSNDRCFRFGKHGNEVENKKGTSIIDGEGVCFNISAHFCDISKHFNDNYFSHMAAVYINEKDGWEHKHPKINIQISHEEDNITSNEKENLLNHVNVLVLCDGNSYLLDPTNFIIYKLVRTDNNTLDRIELRINIDNDFHGDETKMEEVFKGIDSINHALARRKRERASDKTLLKILNFGVDICCKHMKDIIEFREKYDSLYKEIALSIPETSQMLKRHIKKLT